MEGVYDAYADNRKGHTIREIFYSMIGEKSKLCQLSGRLLLKQRRIFCVSELVHWLYYFLEKNYSALTKSSEGLKTG